MPARRNTSEFYDARDKKPAGKREGTLTLGVLEPPARRAGGLRLGYMLGLAAGAAVLVLGMVRRRNRSG